MLRITTKELVNQEWILKQIFIWTKKLPSLTLEIAEFWNCGTKGIRDKKTP
ncbi:hypothetical protein IscW_ISCW002793 [Ixodes scapularis]|uniref:Uncharacterized protein n=1 Tax=Ixodes scapularis TaxID=6945 RepID=B7PAE5_IXOSC|nr:hypothetical protein IscW_ISCW002793 [Ixodes scapularis]|eukprot:XP_002406805.1 hypothetical protein IscW_ISCW002793 [Ixodes scapularis]